MPVECGRIGNLRGGAGEQDVKGSPVYPSGQTQIGVWFITEQRALNPQEPGQGSLHFSLIHAWMLGHSELIVHSGRQFGGDPTYVARQEQDGDPLMSRHCALAPQGEGLQGSRYTSCCGGDGGGGANHKTIIRPISRNCGEGIFLTRNGITSTERITSVSRATRANGAVVVHSTVSILSTDSGTRVNTFLVSTSLVQWTLRANDTLRTTTRWTSRIIGQARAHCLSINFPTLAVGAARGWHTRVHIFILNF